MPAISELTINFGGNGNSLSYLGGGWARAEENFTWAVGQESHLLLPLGHEAREFVLTMTVIPFVHPPALNSQRLIVSVDEDDGRGDHAVAADRAGVAHPGRTDPARGTHPGHAVAPRRGAAAGCGGRDRRSRTGVLGVGGEGLSSAGRARRRPSGAGGPVSGGAIGPGFGIHPGIELKEWVTRRTGLSLPELAAGFESIGENCEFGLVQRRCDTEPLGLLRFSGSFSHNIVRGIEREFEGIGEPEDITPKLEGNGGRREFMIHERKYGLVYHTFVHEGDRTIDLMRQQEATRLKFLRRKFIEELDAGEKIFVFKRATPVPESEILPLFMALNRRRANTLLWVVPEEPGKPSGTVEVLMNGLLKGHIDRFAPGDNAHDFSFSEWVKLCVHAFLLNRMLRGGA